MKSIIAAGLLLGMSHGAAIAGPYANVESNSGYLGNDYQGGVTDVHVGYENALGESASYYIQGGPAFVFEDGSDTETEISGKAGVGVDVTEQLNIYGEISFLTEDRTFEEDLNIGVKGGAIFRFWYI